MTLKEIKEILNCDVLCGEEMLDSTQIEKAFAADLLSDVLAYAKEGTLLVRTVEMLELRGIVFVRGKKPDPETINLARSKNIPMLTTRYILFETCGRLYQHGLTGCLECV